MTLIFLASIALLEYVLRRPEAKDGSGNALERENPVAAPVSANLHNLGSALESFGRGMEPAKAVEERKAEVTEPRA